VRWGESSGTKRRAYLKAYLEDICIQIGKCCRHLSCSVFTNKTFNLEIKTKERKKEKKKEKKKERFERKTDSIITLIRRALY
jgi:Fe-S-cluster containining protein